MKKISSIIMIIFFFVIIPFSIFLLDLFNITQYIPLTISYDWLSFFGSIYASAITILGVFLTLKFQRKSEDEKKIEENKPDIIIDILREEIETKEDIQSTNQNQNKKNDNGIYPPDYKTKIYLKNVGKETAKEIKYVVKIKGLEDKAKYGEIKIDTEKEMIITEKSVIFGYIRNSTFKILALQKNESKELELRAIESIIEILAQSIIKEKKIETDKNDLQQSIIIEIRYQDLLGTKYERNFEIRFSPTVIDLVENKVCYIIQLL